MKRQLTTLLCTGLVVGLTAPSATTVSEAAKKKLSRTSLSMVAGSTYKLNVKGTKKKIKWRSSKKSVATVSTKGKVTAKKAGSATITATVSGKKYRCKVTVKAAVGKLGSKTNPISAYKKNTITYYEEGKKRGKFTIELINFLSGNEATELAKNNSSNPTPEANQEYIYFKFRIRYISGSQTIHARNLFNYYYNIYGEDATTQVKNLDWGFFFENVDDLGTTVLSPGNEIICAKAILVSKGYGSYIYKIQTGKKSFTWFTTD